MSSNYEDEETTEEVVETKIPDFIKILEDENIEVTTRE